MTSAASVTKKKFAEAKEATQKYMVKKQPEPLTDKEQVDQLIEAKMAELKSKQEINDGWEEVKKSHTDLITCPALELIDTKLIDDEDLELVDPALASNSMLRVLLSEA